MTAEELARAKVSTRADSIFGIERVGARANLLNTYFQHTGDADYFGQDLARYEAATADSVREVVRAHLTDRGRVVTLVTPKKGAPIAGEVVRVTKGGAS